MIQKLIPLEGIRKVNINLVQGDLQIIGWERPEMVAKCDEDTLSVESHADELDVSCEDDLALYVSAGMEVHVLEVEGDCDIRAMEGSLRLRQLGGDCALRNTGPAQVDDLDGDLAARNINGGIKVLRAAGDASLKEIGGDAHVDADGDLTVRGLEGNLWARCGGDAALYLRPLADSSIYVSAEGDILAHLPARLEATMDLKTEPDGEIRVDMPGVNPSEEGAERRVVLGGGLVPITLISEGEIIVTSRDDPAGFYGPGANPAGLPADLEERISRMTSEATQKAMEAASMAGGLSELIQARVERAMRKVEDKMKSAEQRARHSGQGYRPGTKPVTPVGPVPPVPPSPPSQPVSEEERLAILKMLSEKKISVAQAETLLKALEGKD